MKYSVHFSYRTCVDIEIEANSEEEAFLNAEREVEKEKYSQHLLDNLEIEDEYLNDNEEENGFTTEDAVRQAFPKMTEGAVGIITSWYENEFALDDFDKLDDYANFIYTDLSNMLEAANDPEEVEIVTVALRKIGYLEEE